MIRLAFWLIVGFFVAWSASPAQATDRIYTLVSDTPFDGSPFGFSGTITTDGSTGYFSDVGFIKDWAITVETPSGVDGVSAELFTRASGPPIRVFASRGGLPCDCLHVTASTISIDAPNPLLTNLVLAIGVAGSSPTSISWIGPYFTLTGRPREVQIVDVGESPQLESRMFGDLSSLPVAAGGVAIPEPATVFLILTALAAVFASRPSHPRSTRAMQIAASALLILVPISAAHADIFQWEYINPADPSQGKQQSTALAPDGAGVDAVPGALLFMRDLTRAYLSEADLTAAIASNANLTNADLSQANLTNASVGAATLTGADLSYANLSDAYFGPNGFQCGDDVCTAPGAIFTGADLTYANATRASFRGATLTGANFTGARIQDSNFSKWSSILLWGTGISLAQLYATASYQAGDLSGVEFRFNDLTGGNFAGQRLTNASFHSATLTDAEFSNADVRGTNFSAYLECRSSGDASLCLPIGGPTLSQLYSTASYQARDLTGINLEGSDLSGGNFAGLNLTNASFAQATLIGANFSHANLTNTYFFPNEYYHPATLTDTDFSAADARGSLGLTLAESSIAGNLIRSDGHINGLNLSADDLLLVRDFDGRPEYGDASPPIPITVDQHLTMAPGGTLRLIFEADPWDSTISFAPGIPVTRGGTLDLTFSNDVNLANQDGRTFDLFDWKGVAPTGSFNVSSPYRWDLSNLYTTGEVTLTALPEPASIAFAVFGVVGTAIHYRRRIR